GVVGPEPTGDLEARAEPGETGGVAEDLPHHLHESLPGDGIRHVVRVLAGEREEEGVLVVEVVEDRAARETRGVLEAAHGGPLEPVLRETRTGTVENLRPAGLHVVGTDLRHAYLTSGSNAVCTCSRAHVNKCTPQ